MYNMTIVLFWVILFCIAGSKIMRTIYKLLFALLAVIGLFLFSFFYTIRYIITPAMEPILVSSARGSFAVADRELANTLEPIVDAMNYFMFNPWVSPTLTISPSNRANTQQISDSLRLTEATTIIRQQERVMGVWLYVHDDFIYVSDTGHFRPISGMYGMEWYTQLTTWAHSHTVFWYDIDGASIAGIRAIIDPENFQNIVGFLRVDISRDAVINALSVATGDRNSTAFIADRTGRILISYGNGNISHMVNIGHLRPFFVNEAFYGNYPPLGSNYFLAATAMPTAGLYLISITSLTELMTPMEDLFLSIFQFVVLICCAAFLISLFALRERHNAGVKAERLELLALQSQIKPHFLYNTLDMINWTAIDNDKPEISETVIMLSKYYKLSLNNGAAFVPMRDELEHAKTFIDITCQRIDHVVEFVSDVSEDIQDKFVLRLLLQPIVENAIIHGILQKPSKSGYVHVKAHQQDKDIIITVRDNGVGIPPEKIAKILTAESGGYGALNTNQRIKLHYGQRYGMRYHSILGDSTTVEIRIPAVKRGVPQ